MDVLVLIDKLDDLVHNAKAVPLTDQVRIDREEIYDILDQMRATIPEEIKQARWIVKERQEMLAEAKRESDRILGEAREQAVREASQTEIVKLAERQAQEIVEDARRQARETRLEMEDWADSILSTLEVNLDKFLGAVRRGRAHAHAPLVRALARARVRRAPCRPVRALPRRRRPRRHHQGSPVSGDDPERRRGAPDAVSPGRPARPLRLGPRRRRSRPPGQDPLPARLRWPLPGLRPRPELRAARASRRGRRRALVEAGRAERPLVASSTPRRISSASPS